MSSFNGVIREYDGVIIDQFCAANCRHGKAFFLSHCHKDHMTGLTSTDLTATLRSGGAQGLYCSYTTRDLLTADPNFEHLRHFMVGLPVDEPVSITYTQSDDSGKPTEIELTVTLVPAGHCPGSTMFLLEGPRGNVLYTGDFRFAVGDSARLASLQNCGGGAKDIDTLYLDTTFCHPGVADIPSRALSRHVVLSRAERWLAQGERHFVVLRAPSFGYEHVWLAVREKLGARVHVSDRVFAYYERALPEVAACLTRDPAATRVHSCRWDATIAHSYRSRLPCGHVPGAPGPPPSVLHVRLSVLGFARSGRVPACGYTESDRGVHVVHSMHASFGEVRDLVRHVAPRAVRACVHPAGPKSAGDAGSGTMRGAEDSLKDLLRDSNEQQQSRENGNKAFNESLVLHASLKRQASWPTGRPTSSSSGPSCSDVAHGSPEGEPSSKENDQAPILSQVCIADEEERSLPMPPKRRRRT